MLTQADFEQKLIAAITDPEIVSRYAAGDPLVVQQVRANAAYFALLAKEIDIATIEPFIKTRDRSIIADATNKGILPLATPCRATLEIINDSTNSITLSQGRLIEDHSGGRIWRLLSSTTIDAGVVGEVLAEQSEYREILYTVPASAGSFHRLRIELQDDLSLADIGIRDDATPAPNFYALKPRWMNVQPMEYAFNVTTDSFRYIHIEFGDDERAGRTALQGQNFIIEILESYGEVDVSRLKDASLLEILTNDEQRVSVRFKQVDGIVRKGLNPLSTSQLRVLANYPSLYDENAVFLSNFEFSVRQKFMNSADFISVWNENEQDQHYGATYQDINHLHIAIAAKAGESQNTLEQEITQYIGRLDSLYTDRVRVHTVVEKPFNIIISGRLAAVHDIDSVKAQIKALLIDKYGQGKLSSSRWLVNGFNMQEVSAQIRNNVPAFQDNIGDFSIVAPIGLNKPHEWVFMSENSITINLERTFSNVGGAWTLT